MRQPSSSSEQSASRHASLDVDEPPLHRYDGPLRVDVDGPPPLRPAEPSRMYDRRPSLEGRLSSQYDLPPPGARGNQDPFYEGPSRRDFVDDRDGYRDFRDDQPSASQQTWGHSEGPPPPPAVGKLHPSRAQLIKPLPGDGNRETGRGSGRGRRQPQSGRDDGGEPSRGNGHAMDRDAYEDRPAIKRGGSLLDRLSLDTAPAASLRGRVDVSLKRSAEEIAGLPPKPAVAVADDLDSPADMGKNRAVKRRNGRSGRRGRRSGVA